MVKDWGAEAAGSSRKEAVMARRTKRREPAISVEGEARTGWMKREAPYGEEALPERGGAEHSANWAAIMSLSHCVCVKPAGFWLDFRHDFSGLLNSPQVVVSIGQGVI